MTRPWSLLLLLLSAPAAGGQLELGAAGVHLAHADADLLLRPSIKADGRWYRCAAGVRVRDGRLVYALPGLGTLTVTRVGPREVGIDFRAQRSTRVEALALEGQGRLPGARAWLSNGAQSWSQSGVIALHKPVRGRALDRALRATGWAEEYRRGTELSWEYSFAGGGPQALVVGSLSARRFRPWVQLSRRGRDGLGVRMVSGGAGEVVALEAGQRVRGERWHLSLGPSAELPAMLERYAERLPARPAERRAPPAVGWNSWYQLFDRVDEAAVRANARRVKQLLGKGRRPTVVIDDGWERRWGEWTANHKFPSGLTRLARDLKAVGVSPGIWLAPFLVDVRAPTARAHPEWFVEGRVFRHPSGRYRILDVTHPGAAAHLADLVRRLVSAGFETLKIDFLATGSLEGRRHEPVTGMQAFHRGMGIIRRAAGPETRLVASGAPGVASFPYVDAWRVAQDVAWELPSAWTGPTWPEVVGLARNLGARWFLHRATGLDTDPLLLRGWRDRSKVHAASWLTAFGGHGLHLSDDLRRLHPARLRPALDEARQEAAMSGVASRPASLIPRRVPRALRRQRSLVGRLLGLHHIAAPEVWLTPDGRQVRIDLSSAPRRWLRHLSRRARPPAR